MSYRSSRHNAMQEKYYKKGLDKEEMKRSREEVNWSVRKKKRDLALSKRRNIAETAPNKNITNEDLPRLANEIRNSNSKVQYDAICNVRMLLSNENPPISQVIELGIAQDLVSLLKYSTDRQVQYQTAWALTNVACGTNEQTNTLLDYGAVPAFISILNGAYDCVVKEQAIWALGNIAADSTPFRDYILSQNVIMSLMDIVQHEGALQITGTWCIANLCRGKPTPHFDIIKQLIPVLFSIIKDEGRNEQVRGDACRAVGHISDGGSYHVSFLFDYGLVDLILPLLQDTPSGIHTPAIRIIGNVAAGCDMQCQAILDAGVLPYLINILQYSTNENVMKELCWTLSNIAAGNKKQIQQLLHTEGLFSTIFTRYSQVPISVKREMAWIVTNICSEGSAEQVQIIVRKGAISFFCDLLACKDPNLWMIVLEGLEFIFLSGESIRELSSTKNPYTPLLEESGGLKTLQRLVDHTQAPLRPRILQFIDQFENDDEMEEEYLVPRVNTSRTEFLFGTML